MNIISNALKPEYQDNIMQHLVPSYPGNHIFEVPPVITHISIHTPKCVTQIQLTIPLIRSYQFGACSLS